MRGGWRRGIEGRLGDFGGSEVGWMDDENRRVIEEDGGEGRKKVERRK